MLMEICFERTNRRVLAILVLALAGCGGGGDGSAGMHESDTTTMCAMSGLYGQYLGQHKNQPPPNEKAFRDYLNTKQDDLQRVGLTIDQMFVSPRNGEPFEWVYGRKPPAGPAGMTYVGYEKTSVDGKRLVIATRGMYEEMDDAKFRTVFPKAP